MVDGDFESESTNPPHNKLVVGRATFSEVGHNLYQLCAVEPVEGFEEHIREHWRPFTSRRLLKQDIGLIRAKP